MNDSEFKRQNNLSHLSHLSYNFTQKHAQDVTNLSGLSSYTTLVQSGKKDALTKDSFTNIRDSLKDLTPDTAAQKLNSLSLNKTLKSEILQAASDMDHLAGTADEAAAAMTKLTSNSVSGLSGLSSTLASLISTPLGMVTTVAAITAVVSALVDAFSHDKALTSAQDAAQEFTNTQAELAGLNNQYDINKQKISELQALQAAGLSTPETDAELSRLQAQTDAIEAQIAAKENLLEINEREANKKGEEYLDKKDQAVASLYDDEGNKYTAGSKAAESKGIFAQNLPDAEAMELSMNKVETFKAKLKELQEQQENAKTKGEAESYQEDIDRYQNAIDDLEKDMAERATNMSEIISQMTETDSEEYRKAAEILEEYTTRNMDSAEWEERLSSQSERIDLAKQDAGFGMEGFEAPEEYMDIEETVSSLREKLQNTVDEGDKIKLQMEIGNFQDIQEGLLEGFSELHPEGFANVDEYNQAWEEYMNNISAEDLVANLDINDEAAMEKIAEIFGIEEETLQFMIEARDNASEVVNNVSEQEIEDKITTLTGVDDATPYINLWNIMSADPKFSSLNAKDQASYVVETYNGLSAEDKQSLISQSGGETTLGVAQEVTRTINSIPTSKSSTVTLNKVTNFIKRFFTEKGSTMTKAQDAGIVKADDSAHFSGTALSGGNWGLPRSGRSLINELGSEIIVRNGRWFVLNGGYPTFANLRAGDIIFNHRQSADILKHGYVTGSHARMVGSARADGTALSGGAAYANGTKFSEQFDKIEILMERMESAFKKITDSVESLSYNLTAQNQEVDKAISQAKSNISSYQKAYDTYMQKANSVGLSSSWQSIVRNGGYDIQEITDEKLKEQIDDYQKYYKKALNIQKDIADLQKELLDLAMQKLKNIDTYYSNRFDYNDDFGYANKVSEIQTALEAYTAELSRQISSGAIIQYSDEWYDAQKEVADYMEKLLEAQWKKYESAIDHISRVSDNLEDYLSLKETSGKPVTEEDYQKQIDLNNQAIEESYNYRQQLVRKQAVYDVGSDLYDKLAKEISSLDSDIYGLMEDNEKLKESIWDIRFTEPFEKVVDGLDETISSTKSLRSLLHKDSFLDSFGNLTENGALNLALLNQEMTASKQKIAEYTTALKKLDLAYQNGIITQEAYEKSQADFLGEIQDAAGDVQDYKDDIIDLYKDQLKAEIDYMDEYYDKRKETLDLEEKYYEFSKKMQKQSKSVNQLKAQIAALQGVKNTSAQAELRRLEQELAEEEADLQELKKDHERDVIDDQYDALSKSMNENMEKTLQELTLNSDKQTQVVSDMLNNIVGMYADAYSKIQQIIGSTGFVGSDGFNQNISNLGTLEGIQGQVNSGTASQGNIGASDITSGVNTGSINHNPKNDAILDDILNVPDIANRPVAQIILSAASLSLVQGKTAAVSASVRPTDAANKTLNWSSSNTSVATVSAGRITGVKPGSALILCTAADGGGASATLSVTVTAPPPKPSKPNTSTGSSGGSGIPFIPKKTYYPKNKLNINTSIVDRLAYHDYDSSMSARRKLYEYWGGQGYYSGTSAQNVWLLNKMKSAGYRKGNKDVPSTEADFIHGGEIIIRKTDGGMLFPLKRGDGVIPSGLTENLWNLAERAPELLNNPGIHLTSSIRLPYSSASQKNIGASLHFDTLLNIEGNAPDNLVDELKSILPTLGRDLTKIVSSELSQDYRKLK